jgi:hypothetical protein
LMERKTEDELLNLSEMCVSNICSGCTHWEFCVLNMQLAIYSLGYIEWLFQIMSVPTVTFF